MIAHVEKPFDPEYSRTSIATEVDDAAIRTIEAFIASKISQAKRELKKDEEQEKVLGCPIEVRPTFVAHQRLHLLEFAGLYTVRVILEIFGSPAGRERAEGDEYIFWGLGDARAYIKGFQSLIQPKRERSVTVGRKRGGGNAYQYVMSLYQLTWEHLGTELDRSTKAWLMEELAVVIGYIACRMNLTSSQLKDLMMIMIEIVVIKATEKTLGNIESSFQERCVQTIALLYQKLKSYEEYASETSPSSLVNDDDMFSQDGGSGQFVEPQRRIKVNLIFSITNPIVKPNVSYKEYLRVFTIIGELAKPVDPKIMKEWQAAIDYLTSDRVDPAQKERCCAWFRKDGGRETKKIQDAGSLEAYCAGNTPLPNVVASYIKKFMMEGVTPAVIPEELQRLLLDLLPRDKGYFRSSDELNAIISLLLNLSPDRAMLMRKLMPLIKMILETVPPPDEAAAIPGPSMIARVVPLGGRATIDVAGAATMDIHALRRAAEAAAEEWNGFLSALLRYPETFLDTPLSSEANSRLESMYKGAQNLQSRRQPSPLRDTFQNIGKWFKTGRSRNPSMERGRAPTRE